jgi:hypothetical protein
MVVVPKDHQIHALGGVALRFFELTLGSIGLNAPTKVNRLSNDEFQNMSVNVGSRIFNALLALSSMGNIIVMTYTAARVKQEIAKEGVIPFPRFFAQSTDMSLGRLLRAMQKKGWFTSILSSRWLSPEAHREKTPVGALILHCLSCVVLIFATWGLPVDTAYSILTSLSSYVINGIIGTFIGLGILILRFKGPANTVATTEKGQGPPMAKPSWRRMTGKNFNPILSVLCASIYTVGSFWPVVVLWIQPGAGNADPKPGADYSPHPSGVRWFVVPTIGWCVIGLGVLWFFGFLIIALRRSRSYHEIFVVEKKPDFEDAANGAAANVDPARGRNGYVMVHETVYLSWVGKETLRQRRPEHGNFAENVGEPLPSSDAVANNGFAGYFPEASPQQHSGFGRGNGLGRDNFQQMQPMPMQMQMQMQMPMQMPVQRQAHQNPMGGVNFQQPAWQPYAAPHSFQPPQAEYRQQASHPQQTDIEYDDFGNAI